MACSRPTGDTASSWRAATSFCVDSRPIRNRWPTPCGARSSGSAAVPRRAPPRRRGASRRRGGSSRSSRTAGRVGSRPRRGSTSRPRSGGHPRRWARAAGGKTPAAGRAAPAPAPPPHLPPAPLGRAPADLLILDEPTNDLDIPTLEVLEDSLAEFDGGLVLVTHDRFMLERVSTMILALDGEGGTATFADYAQWEAVQSAAEPAPRQATERAPARERPRPKRLGYREQREWDGMERAILAAERAVEACQREVDDPAIGSDPTALQMRSATLEAAQADVNRLYARWAELEAKQA